MVERLAKRDRVVLIREPNHTEMLVGSSGEAKAFAAQLIRDRKDFRCARQFGGEYLFVIEEENHPGRWEA